MNRLIQFNASISIVWLYFAAAQAQQDKIPENEKTEMLVARILVLDPDGDPLDGATVTQFGLRSKAHPGGSYRWRVGEFGPEPVIVTNAEGIAEFSYPKYVRDKNETDELILLVEHPTFVSLMDNFVNIHADPVELKLERGFRIAVSAIHGETGEAVKTDLYASLSTQPTVPWKLHDSGMLVSPAFKETDSLLRVMRIVEGKPTLYSDLITIKPEGKNRVLLKDVKLLPGTRVEGRLSDSVPRPVKNGSVLARIVHLPEDVDHSEVWSWTEKTSIADDGSFVFESLPSNEVLQLAPICDDWVSAMPTEVSVVKFFPEEAMRMKKNSIYPQLFELSGGTTRIELEMVAATSARITVLDPNGMALPNASVSLQFFQEWFQTYSSPLGYQLDSRKVLLSGKPAKWNNEAAFSVFRKLTDNDGVAVFRNVPVNTYGFVLVEHQAFEMPAKNGIKTFSMLFNHGRVAESTVEMQAIGTNAKTEEIADEEDQDIEAASGAKQDDRG